MTRTPKTPREALVRTAARATGTSGEPATVKPLDERVAEFREWLLASFGEAAPTLPVGLNELQSHPIAPLFYLLALGLEQLPASPRATGLVTALGKLRDSTEDLINGVDDRHAVPAPAPIVAPEPAAPIEDGRIAVRVVGPQAGRRRLGRQFTGEPQELRVSPEELELLRADPALEVRSS